jgi:predicted nucleotidyltransferase
MLARDFDRTARAERDLAKLRRRGDKRRVRSSLKHLPEGKRQELRLVTQILQAQFAEAVASRTAEHLVNGRIVKIILFGSYARGDWVEDPVGRYFSDYDLLVVVDHERLTDGLEFWEGAEQQLLSELSAGVRLRTPVNFIVHTLEDVNHQLERGRYFFIDIVRDGIVLFDTPELPFVDPQPLVPSHALEEIEHYYSDGEESANERLELAKFAKRRALGKLQPSNFIRLLSISTM